MKTEESFPEIDILLRSHKPDPAVSISLENRILRAINESKVVRRNRRWEWLLLPPAAAAAAAVVLLAGPTRSDHFAPVTRHITPAPSPPPAKSASFDLAAVERNNPLATEARALQHDVERTGRFLIECLPSISSREN